MVSQLAVVTNAVLIAVTSNFVGFEVYRRGGYRDDYNGTGAITVMGEELQGDIVPTNSSDRDQGLSGYANWSSTVFEVNDLVDGRAFPAYSAQSLEFVNADGSEVEVISGAMDGTPILYLPFINFTCLAANSMLVNCILPETTVISVSPFYDEDATTATTFTEMKYENFYSSKNCSRLVFNVGRDDSPGTGSRGDCFIPSAKCR